MEERSGVLFEPEERLMARTFALIHDVTHVAYGHTLEDELGIFVRHDKNGERIRRLVVSSDSHLGETLRSTDFGQTVLEHLDETSTVAKHSWLRDMLSTHADLARKLAALERIYDSQFKMVFDAIRELMAPDKRSGRPIGFGPWKPKP